MLKISLFFASIIIAGCQQKTPHVQHASTGEKHNFFPVTRYLLGQIKELETLPSTPLKITTINGRADSEWIKQDKIKEFITPFTTTVIDSITYHNHFSEKSFLDQSLNAFTFSYDPLTRLPDSMEVKRWDIYVDAQTHKVNRVYIVKELKNDAFPQIIQLIWKPGYYCQITTITQEKGESGKIKEEKLIWNFND